MDYDERVEKLQANLEERAPLLIWRVYRAAETTVPFDAFRIDVRATINGHRIVRAFQVSPELDEDMVEQIIFLTTGFFVRVMASKDSKKWMARWSPTKEE